MNRLITFFCLFFLLATSQFQAFAEKPENPATIYFWVDKEFSFANVELFINGQRIAALRPQELVEYKMNSTGIATFEIRHLLIPTFTQQFEISKNQTYYLHISPTGSLLSAIKTINTLNAEAGQKIISDPTYFTKKLFFTENGTLSSPETARLKAGSGFLLSKEGYIVTNHHVIENAEKIRVKGINGDFTVLYNAKVVVADKNNDIAILKLENSSVKFVEVPFIISAKGAETGGEIYTLGYPTGNEQVKLTTGVISSKTGYQGDITSYQVSAPVQPGNSGGPLFDKQGNLVGIINAKINGAENASYAIKNNYLNTLLDLLPTKPTLNQKSTLNTLNLQDQVKSLSKFVYIVEVNN